VTKLVFILSGKHEEKYYFVLLNRKVKLAFRLLVPGFSACPLDMSPCIFYSPAQYSFLPEKFY